MEINGTNSNAGTPVGSPTEPHYLTGQSTLLTEEKLDWTQAQITEAAAQRRRNIEESIEVLQENNNETLGDLIQSICLSVPDFIKKEDWDNHVCAFLKLFFGGNLEDQKKYPNFIFPRPAENLFAVLCCADGLDHSLKLIKEMLDCSELWWTNNEDVVREMLEKGELALYFKEDFARTGKMRLMKCVEQKKGKKETLTANVVYLPACGNSSKGRWVLEVWFGTACFLSLEDLVKAVKKDNALFYKSRQPFNTSLKV